MLSVPANGVIKGSCYRHYGTSCTFECLEGYELGGTATRTCTVDGSNRMVWTGDSVTCTGTLIVKSLLTSVLDSTKQRSAETEKQQNTQKIHSDFLFSSFCQEYSLLYHWCVLVKRRQHCTFQQIKANRKQAGVN